MLIPEMFVHADLAVDQLTALSTTGQIEFASPSLIEEVLRVFMAFPVVATAKPLPTAWERAAIRPCVALHMFSACKMSARIKHNMVGFIIGLPQITITLLDLTADQAQIFTVRLLGANNLRFVNK